MAARFPRSRDNRRGGAPALTCPARDAGPAPGTDPVDWDAIRHTGRACCCPARPAVVAMMPPAAGRPHPTELLLCGHHYRAGRHALAAAGAVIMSVDGELVGDGTWPLVLERV